MRSVLVTAICVSACSNNGMPSGNQHDGAISDVPASDATGPDAATGSLDAVLYVAADDGTLSAFQVGTWNQIGQWTGLPLTDGVRGVDADPQDGVLYITHGGDSEAFHGSLLAWSLTQHHSLYNVSYDHGVDQPAFGAGKIYLPDGEVASGNTWHVIDAATGTELSTELGGTAPHNTIYQNGHRYYGGREATSLVVIGIGAGTVGPSPSSQLGVRPFTVNHAETRVWITWSSYRGFSVGNVQSGAIVASVNFGPIPSNYTPSTASHGISLSPDGSEVYVLDTPSNAVRVYDSSDAPQLKATVALNVPIFPGNESPCAYDCVRDGWLLHSRDGNYVYVGDSGDIINTHTHQIAGHLAPLASSRHGSIEVDSANGVPVETTTHFGRSYE